MLSLIVRQYMLSKKRGSPGVASSDSQIMAKVGNLVGTKICKMIASRYVPEQWMIREKGTGNSYQAKLSVPRHSNHHAILACHLQESGLS